MASGQTANFGLNQWAPEDKVSQEDFNADNQKLDALLKNLSGNKIFFQTGSYMGTGETTTIHYDVGARPKIVILSSKNDYYQNTRDVFFVAVDGMVLNFNSAGGQTVYYDARVQFDDDGFSIDHSKNGATLGYNRQGYEHVYWVLC